MHLGVLILPIKYLFFHSTDLSLSQSVIRSVSILATQPHFSLLDCQFFGWALVSHSVRQLDTKFDSQSSIRLSVCQRLGKLVNQIVGRSKLDRQHSQTSTLQYRKSCMITILEQISTVFFIVSNPELHWFYSCMIYYWSRKTLGSLFTNQIQNEDQSCFSPSFNQFAVVIITGSFFGIGDESKSAPSTEVSNNQALLGMLLLFATVCSWRKRRKVGFFFAKVGRCM